MATSTTATASTLSKNSNSTVLTISESSGDGFTYLNSGTALLTSTAADLLNFNYNPADTLSSTGSGEEFMPQYLTVYCWQRTA